MDNFTHAMFGALAAETTLVFREKKNSSLRNHQRVLWWTSIAANNFPDIDFVMGRHSFYYLLQHRGFTHTVLMAIPDAFLILITLLVTARLTKKKFPFKELTFLSLIGPLIHIALDSLNNYGVHPFWPFSNRWFYGDSVFILEPLLWLCIAGPLLFLLKEKFSKILCGLVVLIAIALSFFAFIPNFITISMISIGALILLTS